MSTVFAHANYRLELGTKMVALQATSWGVGVAMEILMSEEGHLQSLEDILLLAAVSRQLLHAGCRQ